MAEAETLDPQLVPGRLSVPADWNAIFGRQAPLVVEIGCGGGRFLYGLADHDATRNYLGIERAGEYYKILKERALKRRLPNLRICRTDAADFIVNCFARDSVSTYHIYFPDPWPKKRHHKRRLLTPSFIGHLHRTLAPGGEINLATDFLEYHEEFIPHFRNIFEVQELSGPWPDAPEGRTNFEVKYLREGRPIRRLVARKR